MNCPELIMPPQGRNNTRTEYLSHERTSERHHKPISRSKLGCETCRQRRIKCDERRHVCGPCIRLRKECIWTRRWKFLSCNSHLRQEYARTGQCSLDAIQVSSREWKTLIGRRCSFEYVDIGPAVPKYSKHEVFPKTPNTTFSLSNHAGIEGLLQSTSPPRSAFQVEVEQLHDCKKDEEAINSTYSTISDHLTSNVEWPILYSTNLPVISAHPGKSALGSPMEHEEELQNTGTVSSARYWTRLRTVPFRMWRDREIGSTLATTTTQYPKAQPYCVQDAGYIINLYDRIVLPKLLPFAAKFGLNIGHDNSDHILVAARTFRPLYHALCAITLLCLAFHGKPNVLPYAFGQYQQTIRSLRHCSNDATPKQSFYLYFILFVYDGSCRNQGWPHDTRILRQHLGHIFESFKHQLETSESDFQRHILLRVLCEGVEASLAGEEEAESLVRDFQIGGHPWLRTPQSSTSYNQEPGSMIGQLRELGFRLCEFSIQLSTTASELRGEIGISRSSATKLQARIDDLHEQLQGHWSSILPDLPPSMSLEPSRIAAVSPELRPLTLSIFKIIRLKHSALSLYLHTSMYPQQQLHSARFKTEDAYNRSQILSILQSAIKNGHSEIYRQFSWPVFLTGITSKLTEEKKLALELLITMKDKLYMPSIARHITLLIRIQKEQAERLSLKDGTHEEVDWIRIVRARKQFSFGFCFL